MLLVVSYWYEDGYLSDFASWGSSRKKKNSKWRHWSNCYSLLFLIANSRLVTNCTNTQIWSDRYLDSNFQLVSDLLRTWISQYSSSLFSKMDLVVHAYFWRLSEIIGGKKSGFKLNLQHLHTKILFLFWDSHFLYREGSIMQTNAVFRSSS